MPAGVTPVPKDSSGKRMSDGFEFFYNGWRREGTNPLFCSGLKSPVQPCVDAMPLFIRIKIEGCQSSGNEVVLIEIGFNGSIDDRVDTSISIRT